MFNTHKVGEKITWKSHLEMDMCKDGEWDHLGSRVIQKYLVKFSVPRHLLFKLFSWLRDV